MRKDLIEVDVGDVRNPEELHTRLSSALGFPGWYGSNWDAFWDAITGLVEMPIRLRIGGWNELARQLPEDARLLQECLEGAREQYPENASLVEYA